MLAAIPTVHGAPARVIRPILSQDGNSIGPAHFMAPPAPELNWRTDGSGIIPVQRGHQHILHFTQELTNLPDAYKMPAVMDHENSGEMEANIEGKIPIANI